jgi:MFS family permease
MQRLKAACLYRSDNTRSRQAGALGLTSMAMSQILLVTGNFFILIIALMGTQSCYFKAKWKWFWLMLVCAVISAMCVGVEFYQWMAPESQELPIYVRQPTTPL